MRTGADEATLVRRNLTLPERETARLDHLRRRLEASSDSEIVRQAIRYLAELVEDEAVGASFVVAPRGRPAHAISLATLSDDLVEDSPLVRRNMLMHQSSVERLDAMKELGGIASDSQAIRMALKLYNIIVDEADQGSQFFLVEGKSRTQIRIAGLAPTRKELREQAPAAANPPKLG